MKIAFVDFEAASLAVVLDDLTFTQGSFPIEVGVSILDVESGEIKTWSSLIKPHADWDMSTWGTVSAGIHKISLEDLDTAPDVRTAAQSAMILMKTCDHVMAGHSMMDGRWADMMFRAAGLRPNITLKSFEDMVTVKAITFAHYMNIPERTGDAAHRAGADAEEMAKAFHTMWHAEPQPPESYGM